MLEKIRHYDHNRRICIEAYTDGYAYNYYNNIYLLSIAGSDSAVKGISSAVVNGRDIELIDKDIYLSSSRSKKYRILSTKLSSGYLHQIVIIDELLIKKDDGELIIYLPKGKKRYEVVFHQLKKRYAIPAIPSWSEWLYSQIKLDDGIEELEGNVRLIRISTSEDQLDEAISEGIKSGQIWF